MLKTLKAGMEPSERGRSLGARELVHLAIAWRQPDEGIWEGRVWRQPLAHSKIMAWVAFDRAAKESETESFADSPNRWRDIADEIHAEICDRGFDPALNSFAQA